MERSSREPSTGPAALCSVPVVPPQRETRLFYLLSEREKGGILGRGGPTHISITSACKVFGAQTHMHRRVHTPSNVIPLALPKAENLEAGRAKPLTGTTCDPWPRFKVQGAPFLAPVFFIRRQPGSPGCVAGPRAQQGKRQGKMCQRLTGY